MAETNQFRDRENEPIEDINHLKSVVVAVFKAEDAILDDWSARLKEAPTLGCREKERIADEYVTAIAKELLKNQMRKI